MNGTSGVGRIVAVCISSKKEEWHVPTMPFYCHTSGWKYIPHYPRVKTRERIQYLAERRNAANKRAVELYPDLTHILSIDSYYLEDFREIQALAYEYERHAKDNEILGASTWYEDPSGVIRHYWFWDTWTNPEFLHKGPEYRPPIIEGTPDGWQETRGAGGFVIYPRWAWEKQGYGVPEPFPESGCETNYLSRCPGVRTFITFNVKAWRDPPEELMNKPYINRVRTTVGFRTRLGLKNRKIPDIPWILNNRIVRPRQRYDWLRGSLEKDGLRWSTRGVRDSLFAYAGHEAYLTNEMLIGGRLFVDVGAHVGTWSLRASKKFDNVIAFEPSDRAARVLAKNVLLNNAFNVRIERVALGDREGSGNLTKFFWSSDGGNTLMEKHPFLGNQQGQFVNKTSIVTLDSYGLSPDLLKIDTEGYELKVLEGAKDTLARTRKIIVETHQTQTEVEKVLAQSRFKVRTILHTQDPPHVVGEKS